MCKGILRQVVMFAVLAVGTEELRAGPLVVTQINGTIGQWTLTSPNPNPNNPNTALLSFDTITTTLFNGQPVPAGTTTQLDSFIINLVPVAGPPMFTTFAVNSAGGFLSNPYQFRLTTLNPGGSGASFGLFGNSVTPPNFQPNAIMIPNNSPNTLIVTTTGTPRVNGNPNYDFTNITTFSLTLMAPNVQNQVVNLANIIQNGGTATGTGTFVLTAPEPSSLCLLATGALALAAFVARRPRR